MYIPTKPLPRERWHERRASQERHTRLQEMVNRTEAERLTRPARREVQKRTERRKPMTDLSRPLWFVDTPPEDNR